LHNSPAAIGHSDPDNGQKFEGLSVDINQLRRQRPELANLDDETVVRAIQLEYPEVPPERIAADLGVKFAAPPPESRTLGGTLKDIGISALSGAVGVPEAAVGLADMVSGGAAGRGLESVGFRPKEAKQFLQDNYSEPQRAAFRSVEQADGFMGKLGAAVTNPSTIAHSVIESLPVMGAGGVIGRAVAGLGLGAGAAAAVGEGTAMAGSAAEQIRQQTPGGTLSAGQAGLALATGVGGAAFSLLGAKIAKSLGINDIDTMIVAGRANPEAGKGLTRRLLEGAFSEGVLEELPQSVMEQVLQNKALGKPLEEGVDQAAVMGLLAGVTMGGGANLISGKANTGAGSGATPAPGAALPTSAPGAVPPMVPPVNPAAGTIERATAQATGTNAAPVADPYALNEAVQKLIDANKQDAPDPKEAQERELRLAEQRFADEDPKALRDEEIYNEVMADKPLADQPGSAEEAAKVAEIDAAAHEAATSPHNDLAEPTDGQKEAGNYKVGRVKFAGLDVSIENPQGSKRRGKRPDGTTWEHTMSNHYGYLLGTEGADGDHVDTYIGPRPDAPEVYVVDQINQQDGSFDEAKVMMGFANRGAAVNAYKSNFDKGWKMGRVTAMSMDQFKDWLKNGDLKKPASPKGPLNQGAKDASANPQAPTDGVGQVSQVTDASRSAPSAGAAKSVRSPGAARGAGKQTDVSIPQVTVGGTDASASTQAPADAGGQLLSGTDEPNIQDVGEAPGSAQGVAPVADEPSAPGTAAAAPANPAAQPGVTNAAAAKPQDVKAPAPAATGEAQPAGQPAATGAAASVETAGLKGKTLQQRRAEGKAKKAADELRKKWPGLSDKSDEHVHAAEAWINAERRLKGLHDFSKVGDERASAIEAEVVEGMGGQGGVANDQVGYLRTLTERLTAAADEVQAEQSDPATLAGKRRAKKDDAAREESAAAMQKATEQDIEFNLARVRELERQGRITPEDAQRLLELARSSKDGFDAAMKLEGFVSEKEVPGRVGKVRKGKTKAANEPASSPEQPTAAKPEGAGAVVASKRELAPNPFKTFLIRRGIALKLAKDFAPGTRERLSMGRAFRRDGLEIDRLAEYAAEDGYIRDRSDTDALYDLIARVANGERIGPMYGQDAEAEMQAQIDRHRELNDLTLDDLDESQYSAADAELQERVRALIAEAEAGGIDVESILEETVKRNQNASQDEYHAAAVQAVEAALAEAGSASAQDRSGPAGAQGAEQEAAQGLTAPSEADVLAQQAQREAEAQRQQDGGDKPAKANPVTADQIDLLNPQGGIFDAPAFNQSGVPSGDDRKAQKQKTSKARAWYDRVVAGLPEVMRNDPRRREPVAAEDRDPHSAATLREIEALNVELRKGSKDGERKGYGPIRVDDLGNLTVDSRDTGIAAVIEKIAHLADRLDFGLYVTGVPMASVERLNDAGFHSEGGLATIADRITRTKPRMMSSVYESDAYAHGAIMAYRPRGFGMVLFRQDGAGTATGKRVGELQAFADSITEKMARKVEVIAVSGVYSPSVPKPIRDEARKVIANGGEIPSAVFYEGRVYLFADRTFSDQMAAESIFHEVYGHLGLRGHFGAELDSILKQIAQARPAEIAAMIRKNGFKPEERMRAAEELLAEFAQTQPTIGFVRRAIAAIRTWLRNTFGAKIKLTDDEIIRAILIPAREFVQSGKRSTAPGAPAFNQSDKDILRGTEDEARAQGFTLKAYRGVSLSKPFNDTGTTWLSTSREVAEAYAEEVMGYDDPGVIEVMVAPDDLPRHDASRLTDEQRAAMDADSFGNPQAIGIYDKSDDHPLGSSQRATVIHAPREAVFIIADGPSFNQTQRTVEVDGKRYPDSNSKGQLIHPSFAGQVRFWKWFKGSAVTDESGAPLVVYHGTDADVAEFDTTEGAFFFGGPMAQDSAGTYGRNVMQVYLNIKTPYRASLEALPSADFDALAKKHDGAVFTDPESGQQQWVAFRPEQIKSVFNSGEFSASNPDIRFNQSAGMNSVRDAWPQAREIVHEFGATPGKLNWWQKTLGTPYDLAQRNPKFKAVFDTVQDFLQDVSQYATEAADLAPSIIPKLESWRDIVPKALGGSGKKPLSPEDNKAVGRSVWEGTLAWTRDDKGRPVKMSSVEAEAEAMDVHEKAQRLFKGGFVPEKVLHMWNALPIEQYEAIVNGSYAKHILQPGIVWSDAELKSMFGLDARQIGLYREFHAATAKSLNDMAKSDMLRFAGKDGEGVRAQVQAAPGAVAASEILRDHMLELAELIPERAAVLTDSANRIIDKGAKIEGLLKRGYAPLSRFGKYTVDVVDADGERVYFGLFEGRMDARHMAARMAEQFPGATIRRGTTSEEEHKMFAGMSPETAELFGEMLGLEADGTGAANIAFQKWLKNAKASRSAMKRLIERKGIAGYSEDMGRVLAGFVYSNARQTAQNLHATDIKDKVQDISQGEGELKDAAIRLMKYVQEPQEEAVALRGLLFTQYLGGSIASMLVNMSQPFQVTMPYLSQYGGIKAAAGQMKSAVTDVWKASTGDAALDAALKRAVEQGIVAPQEVHQLMAQAAGRGGLKAGDGTLTGNAMAMGNNALARLVLAWGKPFAMAELFNRRVTFIAAYRTAVKQGIAKPAEFAAKAVDATQFIYNKGNKPEWGRGTVGSVLFTFKNYGISWLELAHRMYTTGGPEGKKAALFMLAMLMLMGGAGGLPFVDDVADLIDGAGQRMGYNLRIRHERDKLLRDTFGDALGGFLDKGVSGLPGVPIDVAGRFGMSNLIPGTGLLLKKADHTRDVTEIAGPVGDLATRAFQGANQAAEGNLLKAGLTVSPKAASNLAKAAEMASQGFYTDSKGKKVVDTDGYDAFVKAIGFQPNAVAKVQQATSDVLQLVAVAKLKESEIADRWAMAVFQKDSAAAQSARDEVVAWNAKNSDSPIRISYSQITKRVREMNKSKSERVASTAPKEIREEVKRELRGARQ
jgi:hypothetical protein